MNGASECDSGLHANLLVCHCCTVHTQVSMHCSLSLTFSWPCPRARCPAGPPAAAMGLPVLCLSRWLVGLGEGVAPSAATALLVRAETHMSTPGSLVFLVPSRCAQSWRRASFASLCVVTGMTLIC